ncbi:hypothetical protein [Streptomyces chrestomyceticus]|uniref:hypothetical protein n=1 Tax=Streptomyces chrestomyceticus TaxID=68185 RepID=UPI0033F28D8F
MTARALVLVPERVVRRAVVAMHLRPRMTLALVVGLVLLAMGTTPPAHADDKDDEALGKACGGGFAGFICRQAVGTPGFKSALGVMKSADSAKKAIEALNPQNFLDEWAKGLVGAVTYLLAFIQATAEKIVSPAYNQPWWIKQYSVSFGLAMIVLPFILIVIASKVGGTDGPVSGVQLLRQSGWRIYFVVPAMAAVPAALYEVQQLAVALMSAFSKESIRQEHGAIGALMKLFTDKAGKWGDFGGTVVVILMCVFIVLGAFILLIELTASQWGLLLAGLIVPLTMVTAIYPPWASAAKRIVKVILGLMFLPAVIFFFFNTVWSAFNSAITGDHAKNSGFTLLLFLLVSLLMINGFPLVAWWLMKLVTPEAEGMDAEVRGLVPDATSGDVIPQRSEKQVEPSSGGGGEGGAGGAGGGGGAVAEDDADGGADSAGGGDGKGPDDGGSPAEDAGGAPASEGGGAGLGDGATGASEGVGAAGGGEAAAGAGGGEAAAGAGGGEAAAGSTGGAAAGGGIAAAAVAAKEGAEQVHDDTQAAGHRAMHEGE